ncbi:putative ubiquitin-conjugating enzyme E2 38 [Punica granatum]|uniref:UBC core domain-containing protein n=2 Tax=Punica granatum TaxID=22663 RepID=A0A218XSP3_PUNGR|nr:putative ubiquitin-conjugating enzyme E2 38 [Punica granatum]OWM88047.1 hypothetical protein CDL15_Pgr016620 [Punica granatum]PKI48076.1 hypothetical protein CRG98_031520 [Punica granatum]
MESDSATASSSDDVNGPAATPTFTPTISEIEEEMDSFQRFDVVSDQETDHFYDSCQAGIKLADSSPAQKKIMQDWKILDKNLPSSIYVRVYENRIDLMRAAIVGAAGTPYHDGLFFFDVCFPPDYPGRPPLVHYRSFGVRINPNLYVNGRVCLSLLNTWTGKKSERWNPNESTVLQVLLSIQALVLNEKPYFNEPGLGMIPGRGFWEKKSSAYTEDVFILSCKTMIWLLRRPPMGFEAFVAAHFRERARTILSACQAYASGLARVGYYSVAAGTPDRASEASMRFKASMRELYPVLLLTFRREGASVGDFSERIEGNEDMPADGVAAGKKKKLGVADKIFRKLGKLLGLKKRMKKKKNSENGGRRKGEFYSSTQVIPNPPELITVGV